MFERDDAQESTAKLGHRCPVMKPIVLLWLVANWMPNDANAHLFGEIRSPWKNVVFKIRRELELSYLGSYTLLACIGSA